MGLAAWFKKVQAEHQRAHEIRASVGATLQAIGTGDPDGVRKALAAIHPADLSAEQKGNLLKAAIVHGDVKTFGAVLAFIGEPNAMIKEGYGGLRRSWDVGTPLLNYALRTRNHDIALALAKDPQTNIESKSKLDYGSPWFMAKTSGMTDVAAVLATRTAELRRQEAAQWEETAARISPAPQVT